MTIRPSNQQTHSNIKQPFFYLHSNFFGNPKKIFFLFQSIMLCFWILILLGDLSSESMQKTLRLIVGIPVIVVLIIEIILISSLWLCSKSQNHQSLISQKNKNQNQNQQETTNNIYHGKRFRDDFHLDWKHY